MEVEITKVGGWLEGTHEYLPTHTRSVTRHGIDNFGFENYYFRPF